MNEIELVILVIVAAILAVSFMFLIAAVFMQRKAERVAQMYGHGLITIEMQTEDLSRLIIKFATVMANSDHVASYCVQLAQAVETRQSWQQKHFIDQIKREMHTDSWFLVYDRDSAERLAIDLWDAVKPKGRVVRNASVTKPA